MKSTLKVVAHPETGLVFTPSKDAAKAAKGWGTVRIDGIQSNLKGNLGTVAKRTVFLNVTKDFVEMEGYKADSPVRGRIVRTVSFAPFYAEDKPVVNPTSGEAATMDEKPYYQKYELSEDVNARDQFVLDEEDVLVGANVETAKP